MKMPPRLRQIIKAIWNPAPRRAPVADAATLGRFLRTRASHVAQTSLYGYLRTRAGTRFPELFSEDRFVDSINIAKWHIWLACLSDLAVYAGGLVRHACRAQSAEVGNLMQAVVEDVLLETGIPGDAGPEFSAHADRVRARLALCDWASLTDDETPFAESPLALVHWAPVVDDLKRLDEEIVRNSIRFRWHEVRRDLRRNLDAQAILFRDGPHGVRREQL